MIILEILKWIGIILLFVLLILLGVLLMVLFLPIKYYGEGTYNSEKQFAFLKARWFWGLVRVKVTFPQKPYVSLKILWIELLKPKQEAQEIQETKAASPELSVAVAEKSKALENEPQLESAPSQSEVSAESSKEETSQREALQKDASLEEETKEPILDKLVGMKTKIQYYIDILEQQETKELFIHCKKRIFKVLKSIRPRKLNFKGTVGFATPDTTGYLYGGYCMISSYLGKHVILTPDFEKEIIDVTGSLKGHITVFVLAWNALRIYFDKRLMRFIRKLKKGGR